MIFSGLVCGILLPPLNFYLNAIKEDTFKYFSPQKKDCLPAYDLYLKSHQTSVKVQVYFKKSMRIWAKSPKKNNYLPYTVDYMIHFSHCVKNLHMGDH